MKFIYFLFPVVLLLISSCSSSHELSKEEIDEDMKHAISSYLIFFDYDLPIYFKIDSNTDNEIASSVYRSSSKKLSALHALEKHLIKDTIPDLLLGGQLNNLCVAMAFYVKYNKYYEQFNNLNGSILETHNWIVKSHQEYLKIIDKKFESTRLDYDCRDFK